MTASDRYYIVRTSLSSKIRRGILTERDNGYNEGIKEAMMLIKRMYKPKEDPKR